MKKLITFMMTLGLALSAAHAEGDELNVIKSGKTTFELMKKDKSPIIDQVLVFKSVDGETPSRGFLANEHGQYTVDLLPGRYVMNLNGVTDLDVIEANKKSIREQITLILPKSSLMVGGQDGLDNIPMAEIITEAGTASASGGFVSGSGSLEGVQIYSGPSAGESFSSGSTVYSDGGSSSYSTETVYSDGGSYTTSGSTYSSGGSVETIPMYSGEFGSSGSYSSGAVVGGSMGAGEVITGESVSYGEGLVSGGEIVTEGYSYGEGYTTGGSSIEVVTGDVITEGFTTEGYSTSAGETIEVVVGEESSVDLSGYELVGERTEVFTEEQAAAGGYELVDESTEVFEEEGAYVDEGGKKKYSSLLLLAAGIAAAILIIDELDDDDDDPVETPAPVVTPSVEPPTPSAEPPAAAPAPAPVITTTTARFITRRITQTVTATTGGGTMSP